jgi:hypothetical protein
MKLHLAIAVVALTATACSNPSETKDTKAAAAEAKAAGGGTAPYVRAHSMQALMANVVDPQAQIYWRSSGSVSDGSGMKDLTPTTPEGWAAARSAAATVAEMGNLMMTPLYTQGRGEDWIPLSQAMVEIGVKAEKAAADHDGAAVFEIGGTMYEVCSACHQAYPPPVKPSAAPAAPAAPSAG